MFAAQISRIFLRQKSETLMSFSQVEILGSGKFESKLAVFFTLYQANYKLRKRRKSSSI